MSCNLTVAGLLRFLNQTIVCLIILYLQISLLVLYLIQEVRKMYDLKKWIENDERVVYELESLLKNLDVAIGDMRKLRYAVDSTVPVERKPNE